MILNSKGSNFYFVFPKGFFPEAITNKYLPYLKRQPVAYESIPQMMNSTIQGISFPQLQAGTVEQTRYLGKKQRYKGSVPIQDLFTQDFTVTFKLLDGYINYFVMLDTLLWFLDFKNPREYSYDLVIRMLDNNGNIVTSVGFKNTILTTISDLTLSYTANSPEVQTFTLNFSCNFIEIYLEAKEGV
jgi:hypothetical protein